MAALDKEAMLQELRDVCAHVGYTVRFERGDFSGGACILKEQRLLVVNKRFHIDRKLSTIAHALREIGVDAVFMKPAVRSYVEDEWSKVAQA
ncbi:MAG: hypothetical protein HY962_13530 [Ignavibacteriae bacterium]|nr:hypothetical protein [Ignavibacteriota bacterium]